MRTIIRTHVKDYDRLAILAKTIDSVKKYVGNDIIVVDDHSPMYEDVIRLCNSRWVDVKECGYEKGTKNGLYWSFAWSEGRTCFYICDDVILGPGIRGALDNHSFGNDAWLISFFASYPRLSHQGQYWEYPVENFYAGLACLYHPSLILAYMKKWEAVMEGREDPEPYQDDLTIKRLIQSAGKKIYNTIDDHAQHTGISKRSFGDNTKDDGSNYFSYHFKGEEN